MLTDLKNIRHEEQNFAQAWQKKIIKTSFTIMLITPLLTACGGGSSGGGEVDITSQISATVADSAAEEAPAAKSMSLSWSMPDSRENGDTLYSYEIGGYEILYKKTVDTLYTSEIVADSEALAFGINNLVVGDYEVKIASFDTNNLMSDYQIAYFTIN